MNEIVWAYDYGGRPKNRWPPKHDTLLWYALDPDDYVFDFDAMDRIPYMAPDLVGPEKAARGKTPTDVWWHTIVPTSGREKTGYPTQKPPWCSEDQRHQGSHATRRRGPRLLRRKRNDRRGSGSSLRPPGSFSSTPSNPAAVAIAATRLASFHPELVGFTADVLPRQPALF